MAKTQCTMKRWLPCAKTGGGWLGGDAFSMEGMAHETGPPGMRGGVGGGPPFMPAGWSEGEGGLIDDIIREVGPCGGESCCHEPDGDARGNTGIVIAPDDEFEMCEPGC
mmetsp:Transcript_4005/g.8101  ORF Transcript_4005/g.8101 Transcript_4005/m.8101 type:complete len:109 (-) Transcript_4005:1981-2307(-)